VCFKAKIVLKFIVLVKRSRPNSHLSFNGRTSSKIAVLPEVSKVEIKQEMLQELAKDLNKVCISI
jgi:hypothetical protein